MCVHALRTWSDPEYDNTIQVIQHKPSKKYNKDKTCPLSSSWVTFWGWLPRQICFAQWAASKYTIQTNYTWGGWLPGRHGLVSYCSPLLEYRKSARLAWPGLLLFSSVGIHNECQPGMAWSRIVLLRRNTERQYNMKRYNMIHYSSEFGFLTPYGPYLIILIWLLRACLHFG